MPLWSANTSVMRPGADLAAKRNVVATSAGWIRRITYTDGGGTKHTKDEILVPIRNLANSTLAGNPKIVDVWYEVSSQPVSTVAISTSALTGTVATHANTTLTGTSTKFQTELAVNKKIKIGTAYYNVASITNNTTLVTSTSISGSASGLSAYVVVPPTVDTYVSFSEPITARSKAKLTIANTASGNNFVSVSNTVINDSAIKFSWKPDVIGTYKIQAQAIANGSATALSVLSLNTGNEAATVTISGGDSGVSNTAGSFTVTA